MRAHLVLLCLLATAFTLSVKGKPHGKHHVSSKSSHTAKEKDVTPEEAHEAEVLPTFVTFEASSQVQEDEASSAEDNANVNAKEDGGLEGTERGEETAPVLLSEEELADLVKEESDEDEAEEEANKEEEGVGKGEDEKEEQKDREEAVETEATEEDDKEAEEREDKGDEEVGAEVLNEEQEVATESAEKEGEVLGATGSEGETEAEEADGSTGSELPGDLDYSDASQPLSVESAKPRADDDLLSGNEDLDGQEKVKLTGEKELLTATDDYEQDVQNTEAADSEEAVDQVNFLAGSKEQGKGSQDENEGDKEPKSGSDLPEPKSVVELERAIVAGKGDGEEEDDKKSKNTNASLTKRKTKKQKKKKNHRVRKHPPQRDEAQPGLGQSPQEPQESESRAVLKAKRRRPGKWAPLVGMNPVQIRATVDLYPSTRPSLGGSTHRPEALADPCDNFRCKRGKTCKLNEDNKPACVCQEPSECLPSVNAFDHVCGTDNNTYDTSCELFATKCTLEGTKKGHKLHLDYTGPCKFIAPCQDTELVQFPLRMRDWLKNVLLQLYEHDSKSPGFLTPKQRVRVRKIFESERRLHAGDHPIELLAMDFEKNYNMYIYPVHWQFAQMDQHPSDRFLTHSELAPLRVPLVPMEHCTSRFFMECDSDQDKLVSFREWAQCFGIKEEDMNVNLLF